MKHFTIENETNNITVYGSAKEADAVPDTQRFSNEAALAKLAADWPAARLVEIWNSLPGESPVKKFKDRATAASRIWKAIQSLGQAGPVAEEPVPAPEAPMVENPEVAPIPEQVEESAAQREAASPEPTNTDVPAPVAPQTPDIAPETPTAKAKPTRAKKAPKTAAEPGAPREGSKTSQVIAMLKCEGGEEIMTAMGWQKHTTRAMLSAGGSLTKNHGLSVTSEKVGEKRVYSIKRELTEARRFRPPVTPAAFFVFRADCA
jgi:hypothetical protein